MKALVSSINNRLDKLKCLELGNSSEVRANELFVYHFLPGFCKERKFDTLRVNAMLHFPREMQEKVRELVPHVVLFSAQ